MSTNPMVDAMLELAEMMAPMGDAVDGYRADLERRGYSPTAAESMAMEFHHYLMAQLIAGIKGAK